MAEDMNIEESTSVTEGTVDSVHSANMILEEEEETATELDNHWKAVNDNPRDFTSWTYLLDYVEKGDDIDNARKAFDQFLTRYPYCYGYWKKFAELERRHHDLERCIEIYERGVKGIPLSVELWTAYLDTALDIYHSSEDYESTIKGIYERAIEAAGSEFRSDKLWEHYISWTTNNGQLSEASRIYDRLLQTTTQMYYQNWENFKKHVEDNETQLVIPAEELAWRKALIRRSDKAKPTVTSEPSKSDNEKGKEKGNVVKSEEDVSESKVANGAGDVRPSEGLNGDEKKVAKAEEDEVAAEKRAKVESEAQETDKNEEKTDESEKATSEGAAEAPEIALTAGEWEMVKLRFIEDREKVYQKTYEQITKRWYFEEKIRRPYFHVKPLEKGQLDNWREYLDFEIEQGESRRITVLFDRCLIACALYEEFWVRYATHLSSHQRKDEARIVWEKACTIHLPHCSDLHWRWAVFEENEGNAKAAVEILTRGHRECPSNVRLCLRRLALMRRSKTLSPEALCGEFETAIERFASENTACASLLSLKYARYLCRCRGELEKAERVLREAIARDETNERLYLQLVDLNYKQPSCDISACDRILSWIVGLSVLPRKTRLRFSQRRCELLEECSDDIRQITTALRALEELKREAEAAGEAELEPNGKNSGGGDFSSVANVEAEAPPAKRSRMAANAGGGAGGGGGSDSYGGGSYDQMGYHYAGEGAGGEGSAAESHHEAHGGTASSYAAAAAAAAANAAYPGYGGANNSSWDSYYNSYYGYYAGYYGAAGTGEHGDWQMQNTNS